MEEMLYGTCMEHNELVFNAIDRNLDGDFGANEIAEVFARLGTIITKVCMEC